VQDIVHNPEISVEYRGLPTSYYPGGLCSPGDNDGQGFDYVIITTMHGGLNHWETSESIPYNWDSLMQKHRQDDGLQCYIGNGSRYR